jgi:hypothetical protein
MIQRFSKLHRIDQGSAGSPVAVVPIQIRSRNQKGCNASAIVSDPHLIQPAAHTQQKCTLEQIGHFDGTFHCGLNSFQILDFFGEMR